MTLMGTQKPLSSPLQSLEDHCRSELQESQVFHERDEATLPFRVEDEGEDYQMCQDFLSSLLSLSIVENPADFEIFFYWLSLESEISI